MSTPVRDIAPATLVADLADGDRRALARAITRLEDDRENAAELIDALRPHLTGVAVVGFTGPPGAGKSTLVNALIQTWRARAKRVAVIAVDPSSPVSGGAILGDRIRMTAALDDDDVFVRSLASHGHLGGLSPSAARIIDAFDAAKYDLVLLETVGTGQNEIDIAAVADVGVVIVAPGLGDGIQAMKSGLLEIADALVVNKSDRHDARQTAQQLQAAISLRDGIGRTPDILQTIATTGTGVDVLADHIDDLIDDRLANADAATRRLRRGRYIVERVAIEAIRSALSSDDPRVGELIDAVLAGRCSAIDAVKKLLSD
ncbi:MAG: methylmalonyl Co-A mutase-associated GTPase MeaB [Hyphomicrobiaceae bacterium]